MHGVTSFHSEQRNDDCVNAVPGNLGTPQLKLICFDSMVGTASLPSSDS